MNARTTFAGHRRRLLRVEDYLCLNDADLLGRDPTELIDGEILLMNAQHRPHGYAKDRLAVRLDSALAALDSPLVTFTKTSVAMPPHDAPQPDIILTSDPLGDGPIPLPSVALLVEVADTTLGFDLGLKAVLYARHGVPEYWVVDLDRRQIVGHSAPIDERYTVVTMTAFGDDIAAATIPGLAIATAGLD